MVGQLPGQQLLRFPQRSVKFRGSSNDGSPYNLLPGATGFAPAQVCPPSRPIKHAHLTEASDDDSISSQEGLGVRTQPSTGDDTPEGGPASQHARAPSKTAAGGRNILTSWAPAITPAQKKAEIVWLDDESYPPLPPPPREPLPFDPALMLTPPHTPPKAPSPLSSGGKSANMPAVGGVLSSGRKSSTNMPAVGGVLNSGRKSKTMLAVSGGAKDGSDEGMREIQAAPLPPPPSLSVSEASFAFPGGPDASGASVSSPWPMNTPHLSITTPPATAHASLSSQHVAHARDGSATSMPVAAHSPALAPAPPSSPPIVPSAAPDRAPYGDAAEHPATTPTDIPLASNSTAAAVVPSTPHPPDAAASASGPHSTPPSEATPANCPSRARDAMLFAASSIATASPNTQDKWGSTKWAWNEGNEVGGPLPSQPLPPHPTSSPPTGLNSSSGSGEPHAALQAHNTQLSPFGSGRTSAPQPDAAARDPGTLQQRPATSGGAFGGRIWGGDLANAVSLDGGLAGPDAAKVDLRDVSGREAWANLAPKPRSSSNRARGGNSPKLTSELKRGSRSKSSSSSSSGSGSGGEDCTTHENTGQAAHVKGADAGSPSQATTGSSGMVQVRQAAELGPAAGRASSTSGSAAQVGSNNARSAARMGSKTARASSTSGGTVEAMLGSKDGSAKNFSSVPGSRMSSGAGSWKEGRASSDDVGALARRRAAFQTKHRVSRFSDPGAHVSDALSATLPTLFVILALLSSIGFV
ncbi:hypothetical protein DUNSADRAFT_4414 [Dunaliella salina]|uniref:Proteophosphoglycan ppg4 n=1 Tax=Dunaliella salina TaxID=3046 RepID=A0ABQ7GS54_DUNSA|nr:hypothetical protein DUNSADRAFT_4414 [Dunaliella salina]|eukprot:KAF5837434.1 hypothetical protein DUNSADRAFT_4414 [Dunaliella salina]